MKQPMPLVAAGVTAVATTGMYLIGADRAFDYDSAVTMQNFVRTDSLTDSLTRQVVFNNHPLFSLLEHLVYSITGSAGEVAMRVMPALFGALAVGVLTWWVCRRWGLAAGLSAAAVLAVNPIVVSTSREIRGYSLLLLMTTLYFVALTEQRLNTRRRLAICSVAIAIGVGTHLYMFMPMALGTTWLLLEHRFDRAWRTATGLGALIGISAYVGMADSFGRAGRQFRPSFPRDLAWELLGGGSIAVLSCCVIVALAARHLGLSDHLPTALTLTGVVLAMILSVWVLAPTDLYPRFFLWLVPALAIATGWTVGAMPWTATIALVGAVSTLAPQLATWMEDPLPTREISRSLASTTDVCATGWPFQAYEFYDPGARYVAPSETGGCDAIVVILPDAVPEAVSEAGGTMPVQCQYGTKGLVLMGADDRCPS